MDFYSGYYFCISSNWGHEFDCRNLVSVKVDTEFGNEDVNRLTVRRNMLDKKLYEHSKKIHPDISDKRLKKICRCSYITLNPEVLQWLNDNVKPDGEGGRGWCVNSKVAQLRNGREVSVFFYRRKDALAFIRRWSVYKKPTRYFSQRSQIRKKLNIKTKTLQKVTHL